MSTSQFAHATSGLRAVTTYLTGHNASSGRAVVQEARPGTWQAVDNNSMAFNVVYTTSSFPASLNNGDDIRAHDGVLRLGKLGLVNPG